MGIDIGATLRKARNRRKVELSEVESATKIRVRFLRAIEDEDWDTLPGDVYARSFIRTYATYLGLDGERLADEYGRRGWPEGEERPVAVGEPISAVRPRSSAARSPARHRLVVAGTVAGLAGLAIAIGLATGGDEPAVTVEGSRTGTASGQAETPSPEPSRPAGLSLELTATAEVWVCLLDARDRPLVNGQILATGAEEGPFRSGSFTVSFGNGEVSMTIDGQQAEIPETSSPVGYAIDGRGNLEPLAEGERPDCT